MKVAWLSGVYYPPAKAELPERPFSHVARVRESTAVSVILYHALITHEATRVVECLPIWRPYRSRLHGKIVTLEGVNLEISEFQSISVYYGILREKYTKF